MPVKGSRARPNEIDGITGATISSESVGAILEQSVQRWKPVLAELAARKEVPSNGHAE